MKLCVQLADFRSLLLSFVWFFNFIGSQDTINSASTITKTLSGQLADGVLKLSEIAATSKGADTSVTQISNGLHEIVRLCLSYYFIFISKISVLYVLHCKITFMWQAEDPTKELSRLISERKFEEAFTSALLRSDVSIVSWLCSQVWLQLVWMIIPKK